MTEPITSKSVIQRQAQSAAQAHLKGVAVDNPYCPHLQPEHHEIWSNEFVAALHDAAVSAEVTE